jgi:WD40-like Beta Propeller Repeat
VGLCLSSRGLTFALVTAACVVLGGGYLAWAALHSEPATSDAVVERVVRPPSPPAPRAGGTSDTAARAPAPAAAPGGALMVRAVDSDNPRLNGYVTQVELDGTARPRASKSLACQRVYYSSGRGLCLALASASGVEYVARIFDRRHRTVHESPVPGLPSRARVSPDGRYGSFTTFVAGDSYAASGAFSTRTFLVDMASGERIANLESFRVVREGETIDAPDFNFWGVTFTADSNRFYATLGTGSHHYLVAGDVAARTVRVLRDGVECPSLSPDGTRIAYKSRVAPETWRLQVLDLESGQQVLLSEARSVDDQPEWLDGGWVAYGLDGDVWAARSDGRGRPRRLLTGAGSPAALR